MTIMLHRRALLLSAVAVALDPVRPGLAAEAILTVSGQIEGPRDRNFTLADLEAEPHVVFSTKTPWHSGVVAFEGIGLDALLDLVGATGTRLRLTALNDYVVEAEIADLRGHSGILAYRENGREIPISGKGPLFLMFPFDSDPSLQHQSVYARCVWQLATIEIV